MIPTHFEVHENALPEVVEAEEVERGLAVSTAIQWVNETITKELQGLVPSNQAQVDHMLRLFFANKVQEDKERKELERSLEESVVPVPPPVMPPPPPPPPAKKKGQKPGRKDPITENPIPPAEPAEPVLCGSMAIGAVSLAIAKTSAILGSIPLYLNIALLKHNQGVEMLLEIRKQINKVMELPPPPKVETKKGHNGSKRGQVRIRRRSPHFCRVLYVTCFVFSPIVTLLQDKWKTQGDVALRAPTQSWNISRPLPFQQQATWPWLPAAVSLPKSQRTWEHL
ncbi:Hypothetical predicted protein [Marmota monax]|uniref:Enolase N-terminal domain-containing protein n=1 Tax=Marmota monax TaxID=9995 RepID=A0A5E4CC74_MARMO|nr:Hypothetical predicted protein [Marmota monax]